MADIGPGGNKVKELHLPEQKVDMDLVRGQFVLKDLTFSHNKDRLFYLLMDLKPAAFGNRVFFESENIIAPCRAATDLDGSGSLTTWTSNHVYIALWQVDSVQKVIRAELPGTSADGTSIASWETFRDTLIFPCPVIEQALSLHYLDKRGAPIR
ncbi:hypothetical protein K461DRAFT_313403 [Myriangium duriaei CBS 260.36]|uniref:Uncharacterized protein n=1 Tax=Myriangium duriaei CBS 260.36 TaxID=1168546 RepID=A0A9P4IZK6_9PEZI|nr:hypothetical protein K461DRAFT_313403 [Myriangium duriaei CBS 260.36]